jgi:hypothetical protein
VSLRVPLPLALACSLAYTITVVHRINKREDVGVTRSQRVVVGGDFTACNDVHVM